MWFLWVGVVERKLHGNRLCYKKENTLCNDFQIRGARYEKLPLSLMHLAKTSPKLASACGCRPPLYLLCTILLLGGTTLPMPAWDTISPRTLEQRSVLPVPNVLFKAATASELPEGFQDGRNFFRNMDF